MIAALAGGVGGAKLAQGLYRQLGPDALAVVVNTADDFDLWGLRISPDADTVMYTLAGIANPATGWGVVDDTFVTLDMLARYGYEPWFRVGDRDFATHIARTEALRAGETLTAVTARLARELGIQAALLPMSDQPVATKVDTPAGRLHFQDYFVRRRHSDPVSAVVFEGVEQATITSEVSAALRAAEAIIFCPSNPIVSIGPILAVEGYRAALAASAAPKIAVSPIVGGKALKGPADQMLAGLGHDVSAFGVAALYQGLVDGIVIDTQDAAETERIEALGLRVLATNAIMGDADDRARFAGEILAFARNLQSPAASTAA